MPTSQKGFAQILSLILLVGGLIATLFLIKNPQIFRSRAGSEPIVFKDINGQPLPTKDNAMPYTSSTKIKIEITAPHPPTQQTVLGQAIDMLKERAKGKPQTKSTPTPSPTTESSPSPAVTPSPTPTPSPTTQEKMTTVSYKLAEDPTTLETIPPQPYNTEPTVLDYEFKDQTPGIKSIFVKFIFSDGTVSDARIRQIELVAAPSSGVTFKTYKGLDFPWGLSSKGVSTYTDWLSTKYDEAAMVSSFDEIKKLGVLTVGKFLYLDRMLVKDETWGTDAYKTQWNPAYKANWESFLKNVVKPRGMELVVTLLTPASDTDRDPTSFERSTFVPVVSGTDLLGPTTQNGNMETGTGILPDGWTLYRGDPGNTISWETAGGQTNGSDRYLKLTSLTTKFMTLYSPAVSVTRGTLLSLSIYYQGDARNFFTEYLDASGNVIDRDMYVNKLGPTTAWTKVTWASREGNDMPAGTVKVRLTAQVVAGKIASFDSVQIAPGARNAKWKNYMAAVKDWVTMYGSNSEYGPAIVAWIGIKEVYDSVPPYTAHAFSRDLYQAIKQTGTTQTVGIDSSPLAKLPVTDPQNLGWYNDAADFYSLHIYKNDGILPDTSKLDKPFILGEFGADWKCPNGGIPPDNCTWQEVSLTDPTLNLTATSNLYQNALAAGAKTALAWEWVNRTVATHTNGVHTLAPVGEWIKNWNP